MVNFRFLANFRFLTLLVFNWFLSIDRMFLSFRGLWQSNSLTSKAILVHFSLTRMMVLREACWQLESDFVVESLIHNVLRLTHLKTETHFIPQGCILNKYTRLGIQKVHCTINSVIV